MLKANVSKANSNAIDILGMLVIDFDTSMFSNIVANKFFSES